jgi:hypothetical protein
MRGSVPALLRGIGTEKDQTATFRQVQSGGATGLEKGHKPSLMSSKKQQLLFQRIQVSIPFSTLSTYAFYILILEELFQTIHPKKFRSL